MNRFEKLMRVVALVLGGEETLPAALPGDVHATGARVELALLGGAIGQELLIAHLVAAPNQHVPAVRGRRPELNADLIALDHIERLGRGRHADRIGDGPARGRDQGHTKSRHGEFAAHRAPSPAIIPAIVLARRQPRQPPHPIQRPTAAPSRDLSSSTADSFEGACRVCCCPRKFARARLWGVMAGLVPAIHVAGRTERPQASSRSKKASRL